ncbi:MAG: hypothetical protein ABIL44_01045 [candidate division WOR-3 bacterium]
MKIEKNLNPNCSEAVFRFGGFVGKVDTSDPEALKGFAQGVRQEIKNWKKWYKEKRAKEQPLIAYDNLGGGANFDVLAQIIYALIEELYENKEFNFDKVIEQENLPAVPIVDGPCL